MTGIAEKALADFQAFETWLHQERPFDSDVLYRGHGDSTWSLESTLYRHRRALFPRAHPALHVPVAGYADAAQNLQHGHDLRRHERLGTVTDTNAS